MVYPAFDHFKQIFSLRVQKDPAWIRHVLKGIGVCFYFIASIYLLAAFFLHWSYLSDGFLFFILGYGVARHQSRAAAGLLLLTAALSNFQTFLNATQSAAEGGKNILLAVLCFFLSVRGLLLTFEYHRLVRTQFMAKHFSAKLALAIVYYCAFLFLTEILSLSGITSRTELGGPFWEFRTTTGGLWIVFMSFAGWLPGTAKKPICEISRPEEPSVLKSKNSESLKIATDWQLIADGYWSALKSSSMSLLALPQSHLPYPRELIRKSLFRAYQKNFYDEKLRRRYTVAVESLARFVEDEDAAFIRKMEEALEQTQWENEEAARFDRILEQIEEERKQSVYELSYQKPPEPYLVKASDKR